MMSLRKNPALSRLTAIGAGAAIQVFVVLVVALVWRRTAGHWGPGAWVIYLASFGLAAPVVGLSAASRVGQWRLTTRQFAASTILLVLLNVAFALMEPGLAEGGISPLASLGGYCIVLLALFAALSTQKQSRWPV
jgi:hypothetical protein